MKTFLFSLFLFAPLWVAAQVVDSSAIRQVDSLLRVARSYSGNGEFDKALETVDAAEQFALSTELGMGPVSAEYGSCCHTRGQIFIAGNDYNEAAKWNNKAISIRSIALGKASIPYCGSVINQGDVYRRMGQFEIAEMLLLEAKDIFETKLNNRKHQFYIICMSYLGMLYTDMGRLDKSETIFLELKETLEARPSGRADRSYVSCVVNLGIVYVDMGQFEKAEALFLEAKKIWSNASGEENHVYATILTNLATTNESMGNFQKSEQLHLEAISIYEKVAGKEDRSYTIALFELGMLYFNMGENEKAEQRTLEAISIREKTLGKEHPLYLTNLVGLGVLYLNMGRYDEAERLFLEAEGIQKRVIGKEHPDYAITLIDLILLYWSTAKYEQCSQIFEEYTALKRFQLIKATRHLSEQELNIYLNRFTMSQDQLLSFTQEFKVKNLALTCYDNALFYKGFLLSGAIRLNNLAESSPEVRELHIQLKSYQRLLAAEYALPIADREGVDELEEKANAAEKELTRMVAGYGEASRQIRWNEVQAALKPGEAAVEFVRFNFVNPDPTDSVMYAALVLRPGFEAPQFIPLFEEKSLAALLQQSNEKQADQINTLYNNPALYVLLWQPLEKALTGAKTVYFSTDGLLHRLNLRAIATPDGHILADRCRLIRMNSTRQLVIPPSTQPVANDALVYGGIQYDMDAGAIQKANASLSQYSSNGTRGELDFHQSDSTLRLGYRGPGEGGAWQFLPFTEVEAGLLQHDLQEAGASVRVLSGYAATEESFKAIGRPSPRILHLATHGFFFPDPKETSVRFQTSPTLKEPVFKISDHPMIRSGLLLAGANYAWKSGQPLQPGMEDGILTAYEISQMDLSNTELAVLSACETGLGDIAGNEGVYGLQRAFKIAGTRYLLMSLWKIPDLETQQLMTTFYRHWLKDGKSVPDAFQITQQEMREKYKDPYLWAGFVLVE